MAVNIILTCEIIAVSEVQTALQVHNSLASICDSHPFSLIAA